MASNVAIGSARPPSRRAGARKGLLASLVVWAFVAFVVSLPFEAALLLGGEGYFSISRLLGYVFIGFALLEPRMSFRKPPGALWWFAVYVGLYVFMGLYQAWVYWPEIFSTIIRLIQFLVLLWLGYNMLQQDQTVKRVLWGFGLSCVVVGGLLVGGVGTHHVHRAVGRETVFSQGPNTIAGIIALGGVTLIGMAYGKASARRMTKFVAWAGFFILTLAITRTGSRGALVELGAGLMTLLASRGSVRTRMRNAVIVILAFSVCLWVTISSAVTASRWESTIEQGDMAGRQRIFRAAWVMFEEKPILGWGPATNYYELGVRVNRPKRDTHNLLLWLLTEQGIVGTIPFCVGLALCVRAAWRARKGVQGPLPLALVAASLTVNLSGTYHLTKSFWLILAYALASEMDLRKRRVRLRLAPIRPLRSGALAGPRPSAGLVTTMPRWSAARAGRVPEAGSRPAT